MTQEDKQLLLVDLCARVPYHPKGRVVNSCNGAECDEWLTCATFTMFTNIMNNTRLYLRPMSSMTEEEKNEFALTVSPQGSAIYYNEYIGIPLSHLAQEIPYKYLANVLDWLNAHHFDYRGLIPKGLALSTEVFNPYQDLNYGRD